jgi:hypothetical protein
MTAADWAGARPQRRPGAAGARRLAKSGGNLDAERALVADFATGLLQYLRKPDWAAEPARIPKKATLRAV